MPINRIFGATTFKVGAMESSDVGAFIGGHGLVERRLEKFLQAFETANEKNKKKTVCFALFCNKFIYSGKHQIRIPLNSSAKTAHQTRIWLTNSDLAFLDKSGFDFMKSNPSLCKIKLEFITKPNPNLILVY